MFNRIPTAVRHTLLYGSSIALMKGISLLMLPVLTYYLTPESFGRLEVIFSLSIVGSVLVGMGLEATLFRFAGSCTDSAVRKQLAGQIFSLALIIGLLSAIVLWIFSPKITAILPGDPSLYEVRITLLLLSLEGCIAVPLGWLRMRDKVAPFFFITTGRACLQALLTLGFLMTGGDVAAILEAGLIAALTTAFILFYLQIKDTPLSIEISTYKSTIIYSLPLVLSGLVAFSLNGFDRWVLAQFASLIDVAHFGVAAKFSLAVVLLIQPFGMWWSPRRFTVLNQKHGHKDVARFVSIGIVTILLITIIVAAVAPILIHHFLPETYAIAASYTAVLIIVMALKEITELVNLGCFTGKTTHIQFIINLVSALIGIVCMYVLTPNYAVWGVLIGLTSAQASRLVLFFYFSQRFLPLPYAQASLVGLTVLTLCCVAAANTLTTMLLQTVVLITSSVIIVLLASKCRLIPTEIRG